MLVNNGFQQSAPASGSLTQSSTISQRKKPVASILYVTDGTLVSQDAVLTLVGEALDPENGQLAGARLDWFLSGPGIPNDTSIGSGPQRSLRASDVPGLGSVFQTGAYILKLRVTDTDGNQAFDTSTFFIAYNFNGFLPPVNNEPMVNTGKAGRTYPVKFQLTNSSGNFINDLSAVTDIKQKSVTCGEFSGDPADALETQSSGGSQLRYDAGANQFVYNWATPPAGCYQLFVYLNDGSIHSANFQLS